MANKKLTISTSGLIALALLAFFVSGFLGINPYFKPTTTGQTTTTTTGTLSNSAYCQGAAGIVSLPGNAQCYATQIKLQISPTNLLGQSLVASKYSIKWWQNVGSPATFSGSQIIGGLWQQMDQQKCGAAPTSCTTSNGWPTGTQVAVQVCENQTPTCAAGDYIAKEVDELCPLPSLAPFPTGTALQTACGAGPGAGIIPFSAPSNNPPVTINFNLPIPVHPGSTDDGYNQNSPNCIQGTLLNGTAVPAAPCSAAGTETINTKNCTTGAPCIGAGGTGGTTTTGRFPIALTVQTGGVGGAQTPAVVPFSVGSLSYYPVDPALQNGVTARGLLQTVLVLEIKATTGTDMCFTQSLFAGISPTVISKSGTDTFYIFPLPDSGTIVARDSSGTVYSTGLLSGTLNFDCSAVLNGGSTDVVTLTFNEYAYFSLSYFKYTVGSLNPEVPVNSSSGIALNDVFTIKQ